MLYFLGVVIVVSLLIILIFIRTSKDTKRKISYKDRAKLESTLDDVSALPKVVNTPVTKSIQPSLKVELPKDYKSEILRFKNRMDPDDEDFNMIFKSAFTELSSGDYKSALNNLNNAVNLKPFNFQVNYCRGLLNCLLKNYKDAIDDFTETIRLEIDEKNALYFRGVANFEAKDLIGAEQDFNSFASVESQFPETYLYLGMICSKQNRFDEASRYFSKVITLNPKHGKAFFERAMVKLKEDNKEGCCKDLRASLTLGNLEAYHHIKEICEERPA